MELIEVRALINDLNERRIPFNADINEAIITAPIVDAEPIRHGKWIYEKHWWDSFPKCNLCGEMQVSELNYCPNCGARMDEIEE